MKLVGWSGYDVELQDGWVVKSATMESQNARLIVQRDRQHYWASLEPPRHVPRPSPIETINGLSRFCYPYVVGTPLSKVVEFSDGSVDLSNVQYIVDWMSVQPSDYQPTDALHEALSAKVIHNAQLCGLSDVVLERLLAGVARLPDLTPTLHHGDFCLDNMILDGRGNIWLIDFLDLTFPHFWFDISKLFQDLDGVWSKIRGRTTPTNELQVMRSNVMSWLSRHHPDYLPHHTFLSSFSYLRILPYCQDPTSRQLLTDKIQQLIGVV